MGILDKVKNLFTEEYEEEVPIKKEVKHVEITPPRRDTVKEVVPPSSQDVQMPKKEEVKKVESISDSTALNREERFKFPVYFDDSDFEDLPKKDKQKKVEVKKEETPKVEPYKASKMVEEKKNFRPSPIISPVYGVLDKNYKKEDIGPRRDRIVPNHPNEEHLNVDDVRKKAFGTLEDELENTLIGKKNTYIEEPLENEIDIFKELEESDLSRSKRNSGLFEETESDKTVDLTVELQLQKQKIDEIDAYIKENSVKRENTLHSHEKIANPKKEEMLNNLEDATKEEQEDLENGDLFDLIDSMYEKRDEA